MPDVLPLNSVAGQTAEGGGSASQVEPTEEVAASQPNEQPPTLAQVQDAISKALSANQQQISRSLQSQLDKRDAGIRKQIAELKAQSAQIAVAAQATGIKDTQAQQLGQAYFNNQLDSLLAEQQAPNGKGQGAGPNGANDGAPDGAQDTQQAAAEYAQYVTQNGDVMRQEAGLELTDLEMKLIVTDQDEKAYYASIIKAGKAKAERLAREAKSGKGSRIPGLGPDGARAPLNSIESVTDTGQLYKLAAQEERKARQHG